MGKKMPGNSPLGFPNVGIVDKKRRRCFFGWLKRKVLHLLLQHLDCPCNGVSECEMRRPTQFPNPGWIEQCRGCDGETAPFQIGGKVEDDIRSGTFGCRFGKGPKPNVAVAGCNVVSGTRFSAVEKKQQGGNTVRDIQIREQLESFAFQDDVLAAGGRLEELRGCLGIVRSYGRTENPAKPGDSDVETAFLSECLAEGLAGPFRFRVGSACGGKIEFPCVAFTERLPVRGIAVDFNRRKKQDFGPAFRSPFQNMFRSFEIG